jgi:signal transduction histidine kinase
MTGVDRPLRGAHGAQARRKISRFTNAAHLIHWLDEQLIMRRFPKLGQKLDNAAEIFDLGIPKHSVPADEMRRIRIICITTLAMFIIGVPSVIQFWHIDVPHLAMAVAGTMIAGAANLLLLRVTQNAQLGGHLGLVILTSMFICSSLSTGGFSNPNFAWLYVLPLGAAVIINLRAAAIWTGVTLSLTLGFWLLPTLGIELPNLVPEAMRPGNELFTRFTTILAISFCAASFVTGQRKAERQLEAANADIFRESAYVQILTFAAVSANQATSFEKAMQESVEHICTTLGWMCAHICNVTDDGVVVSSGFFYMTDAARFEPLRQATARATYRSGEGLPGRALASAKPEHVENLEDDSLRDRSRIAQSGGLLSGFAVPVPVNGKVRAVLEFAANEKLANVDRLLELFEYVGVQLGRVAERAAIQERLRQSQKLEAVGQLAAGLAHEINNPMSYVRSNLHSLREEWSTLRSKLSADDDERDAGPFDDCQDLIEESLEGVERTIAIVRDVKEFSHLGTTERSEWKAVSLTDILDGALRVASSRSPGGVSFEHAYATIPACYCSPDQLRQVFVNLIVNAIQAVGDAGVIRLTTTVERDTVIARVEDDGPGMGETTRERLFDPFFTTKPVGEGTGLGLSVSYEIIRNHGGEIRVTSELGTGTVFEVRLPVAQGSFPSEPAPEFA